MPGKRKYSNGNSSKAKRKFGGRYADPSYRNVSAKREYDARNMRVGGYSGVELKNFDNSHAGTLLTSNGATNGNQDPGTSLTLFCPVVGTNAQNRIGRKTMIHSVAIDGFIQLKQVTFPAGGVAMASNFRVFIALVQDKQSNATSMTSQNVYENISATKAMGANPARSLERIGRFKVLKQWHMDAASVVGVGNSTGMQGSIFPSKRFHTYQKVAIPVEHIASGGTFADIQDNSLHIIAWTTEDVGAFEVKIHYNSRCRFTG